VQHIADLNSYGARRGNHSVMARGTFSNIKMENKMLPKAGPYAVHYPSYALRTMHCDLNPSLVCLLCRQHATQLRPGPTLGP
jgi:hypothetical protein